MKYVKLLLIALLTLSSCSNDDNATPNLKNDFKQITSFIFRAADNDALNEDVKGVIDETKKTIVVVVQPDVDITALKPWTTISVKATISPENDQAMDFSDEVEYTVTAEDGSKQKYVVIVTVLEPVTERDALLALYNANPDNELGWDLNEQDISKWEGITVEENSVTQISLDSKGIINIPKTISAFRNLDTLILRENGIKRVPASLGGLIKLKFLDLERNEINELPDALIGLKDNLEYLHIGSNKFTALPQVVTRLTNLKNLLVWVNPLTELSPGIGNLENLEQLRLDFTRLSKVPKEIGKLKNLKALFLDDNTIKELPREILELSNLEFLSLDGNDLEAIPDLVFDVKWLKGLNVEENLLTALPTEIEELSNLEVLRL